MFVKASLAEPPFASHRRLNHMMAFLQNFHGTRTYRIVNSPAKRYLSFNPLASTHRMSHSILALRVNKMPRRLPPFFRASFRHFYRAHVFAQQAHQASLSDRLHGPHVAFLDHKKTFAPCNPSKFFHSSLHRGNMHQHSPA
jgi:hypothetical protein